jgi:hypothetical protein
VVELRDGVVGPQNGVAGPREGVGGVSEWLGCEGVGWFGSGTAVAAEPRDGWAARWVVGPRDG